MERVLKYGSDEYVEEWPDQVVSKLGRNNIFGLRSLELGMELINKAKLIIRKFVPALWH